MRTIFHLDLDAFFVSVERILDPSLEGKPVIVGANPLYGRGVVAACSYEAREYGLHSGMPIKQAYKLCPNGLYVHGSHGEYGRFSHAVKYILEKYAPLVEQASIDEFYMDFTGCRNVYGSLFMFASELQKEIYDKLALPCSIGIGGNKTIAKVGSDCMKPKGITYVIPGFEKEFLAPMPAEAMPGIGKVTIKELHDKGYYTLGDIASASEDYFAAAFGKPGISMWHKAHGEGNEFLSLPQDRKSISHQSTFKADEMNKRKVEEILFRLTGQACQTLRDYNWQASTISIKLRYSDFVTHTRSRTITPTDDDKKIYETGLKLLRNVYTRRVATRLVGIHLSKFNYYMHQEKIFETEEEVRSRMLGAVSQLRGKFGYEIIRIGRG